MVFAILCRVMVVLRGGVMKGVAILVVDCSIRLGVAVEEWMRC
jgi:hypothetical protein